MVNIILYPCITKTYKENMQACSYVMSSTFYTWFVAAARGECEGGNQKEEKFCLFHIAYFEIFKPSLADGVLPL